MKPKKIVSFGFRHGDPAQTAGITIVDVRQMFRNPYHDRKLRYLRGTDPAVQQDIMKTPNFHAKYRHVRDMATSPGTDEVWIGCHGGHHRSVFLAEKLGLELGVPVEHRDLTNP